jgi:hypothetical protein
VCVTRMTTRKGMLRDQLKRDIRKAHKNKIM